MTASICDLRDAFEDLAARAPTPDAAAHDAPFVTATPIDLVRAHPSAHLRRGALASALAIAAAAIVTLIVLRTGLSSDKAAPADPAQAVCGGTVSICITGDTPAWSVTLKVNGRFAPPIGSESWPPPGPVRLVEATAMSFQLSLRNSGDQPIRDVYLYAYGRYVSGGDRRPPGGDALVLLHRQHLLRQGQPVTGSWLATTSPLDHDRHLHIGVSFRLGAIYKQIDITQIVVNRRR